MSQMKAQIDKLLTSTLQLYTPTGYGSEQILTPVSHSQWSGKLGKISNAHLRIQNTIMGGEGAARRIRIVTRETDSFEIESHGLEGMVTERDRDNFDSPYDARKEEAMALTHMLWLGKEKSLADTLSDTAIVTQNVTLAGGSKFSDKVNSDPLSVVQTGQQTIEDAIGVAADTMIMNTTVFRALQYHPLMIEFVRGKVGHGMRLTVEEMASAFQVERILVLAPKYNSANEGQNDSLANVWGNHLILGVLPQKPRVGQLTAGYYVTKKGLKPRKVSFWNLNNPPRSQAVLVEDHYDFLLSKTEGLYLIKNAV